MVNNKKTIKSLFFIFFSAFFTLSILLTACSPVEKKKISTQTQFSSANNKVNLSANEIVHKYLIIDTHIDIPERLSEHYEDISVATEKGDFDYPRALKGGLNTPFMSIYIPSELQITGGSKQYAEELIDMVENIVKKSPNKFALAYSTKQVETNFAKGLMSLPMGMENGSPIEEDLANLKHFYDRGIRYITLTHAKANQISDSSYDDNHPAQGLTAFGKAVVTQMNNLGIMVDISHVSDEAFYQVMELSKTPVIASHSSARFFTPGFERNMNDEMIKLLAKNGGVIQISFGSSFISQKTRNYSKMYNQARSKFIAENNVSIESAEVEAFKKTYKQTKPYPYASRDEVLDHFDHVVKLVGIDHVGIGSDYEGVGDSLPIGLKDVSSYPYLIQGFIERGYSEEDIHKILSGNILRVWRAVEAYAQQQSNKSAL